MQASRIWVFKVRRRLLAGILLLISTNFMLHLVWASEDDASGTRYQNLKAKEYWMSGFLDMGYDPFHNTEEVTLKGLFGKKHDRLELYTNEAELSPEGMQYADMDMFYWHQFNKFLAVKGGANYFYRPTDSTPYWQPGVGLEATTLFDIDSNIRVYFHEDSVKLDAEFIRDTHIIKKFFVKTSIRSILATKTVSEDEIGSGLNQMRYFVRPFYRLTPDLSVFFEFEYLQDYGSLEDIRQEIEEETGEHLFFFGLSLDF